MSLTRRHNTTCSRRDLDAPRSPRAEGDVVGEKRGVDVPHDVHRLGGSSGVGLNPRCEGEKSWKQHKTEMTPVALPS
jgi:hypothetical protein